MDVERIDRWCERGIFGITLLILIFAPLAIGGVRSFEFVYIQGATIAIALLWLVRAWIKPVFEIFWPPICWPVLAFLVYAFVRYSMVDIEYVARTELIRVCVYAVLFLAIVNNLQRSEYLQIMVWTVIGLGAVASIVALVQFGKQSTHVWNIPKPEQYWNRGSWPFINPNNLAGFLEILLPITLATMLLGRINHVLKIVLGYVCLLLVAGIGVTLSRGGWISTGLTMLCFSIALFLHTRSRWVIISVILVSFVAVAGYMGSSLPVKSRFERTFMGGKIEDARFSYWGPAVKMWKEKPWIGVGPGHFDVRFPAFRPPTAQSRPRYAHNDYLNTLAEWGIVGLAIVISFVVLSYLSAVQALRYLRRKTELGEGKSNRTAFVFGGGFALLSLLLHSVTDFNMQIPANAILLLTVVALIATQIRYSDRFWIGRGYLTRPLATAFLLGAVVVLGLNEGKRWKENQALAKAQKAETFQAQVAGYKAVVALEPGNAEIMTHIGDLLRTTSLRGDSGYEAQAKEAIDWYEKASKVNPYSPYNVLWTGVCYDWLGQTNEGGIWIDRALAMDPNNQHIMAYKGWHYINLGDYATAEEWLWKCLRLGYEEFAARYVEIVQQRRAQPALWQR
jgi:O-antigen ligase